MSQLLQHALMEAIGRFVPLHVQRWAFVTLGVTALGGSIVSLVIGIPVLALVLLAGAALFGAAAYVTWPRAKAIEVGYAEHHGAQRPAFVVRVSRGRSLIGGIVCAACAAAFSVVVVASYGSDLDVGEPWNAIPAELRWPLLALIIGVVTVLSAGMAVVGLANGLRGARLAVMREGIAMRSGLGTTFVPWSLVTKVDIDTLEVYGKHSMVVVGYRDGPGLHEGVISRAAQQLMALSWMSLPARRAIRLQSTMLLARDRDVALLLAFFHANPDLRGLIGSSEGLRRALATPVGPR